MQGDIYLADFSGCLHAVGCFNHPFIASEVCVILRMGLPLIRQDMTRGILRRGNSKGKGPEVGRRLGVYISQGSPEKQKQ